MKRILRWLQVNVFVAGPLFLLSGHWNDPWLWTYVAIVAAITLYALVSISDDLTRERFTPPEPGADRLSLRAIRLIAAAHLVVGALDSGRFHWTTVPDGLRIAGLAGLALSFLLIAHAMRANRFFSAVVRVQNDRGHHVVDRGPYAVVRHPGYAGMIPAIPFSALALGSWVSFAIALVYSALIVRRVRFEDRFLQQNLTGYAAYAQRVRYKLLPGGW
jgi:protein-S-isoprenylcysteine O-methyltransferase Ste14